MKRLLLIMLSLICILLSTNNTYVLTVGGFNTTLSAVYVTCKGGEIEGAGSTLAENSFALTEHSFPPP